MIPLWMVTSCTKKYAVTDSPEAPPVIANSHESQYLKHIQYAMAFGGLAVHVFSDVSFFFEVTTNSFFEKAISLKDIILSNVLLLALITLLQFLRAAGVNLLKQKDTWILLALSLKPRKDHFPGWKYSDGPLLNPLGLAKDIKNGQDSKLKEIKNGEVAMLGFSVQVSATHVGQVEKLLEHLSDPWQKTIFQTLANSSS
ncbi:uncharacterized protein LOC133792622 [Humulus lupulus]|uniref:uncharacterized protein LOC133792622 n=1 Tax=Humulus lupulus TaxID=3486 RepID=UPI002B40BAC3|nr:uncharacterized protein LOC133792622 [Humulus lupulus]